MKTKKQKKSDAEFIAKIKTLNVITKSDNAKALSALAKKWNVPEEVTLPCGHKGKLAMATETEIVLECRRKKPKHDDSAEMTVTE